MKKHVSLRVLASFLCAVLVVSGYPTLITNAQNLLLISQKNECADKQNTALESNSSDKLDCYNQQSVRTASQGPATISKSLVYQRIEDLKSLVGTYFTVNRKGCLSSYEGKHPPNNDCKNCCSYDIMKAEWWYKNYCESQTPLKENLVQKCWSCWGFGYIAQWYIFRTNNNTRISGNANNPGDFLTITKKSYNSVSAENAEKNLRLGDVIHQNGHVLLYCGCEEDADGKKHINVLDSNNGKSGGTLNCFVRYYSVDKLNSISVSRVNIEIVEDKLDNCSAKHVYFGMYPMDISIHGTYIESKINEKLNYKENGDAIVDGTTYTKLTRNGQTTYLVWTPIKWRAMETRNGKVLLLCDKSIDNMGFSSGNIQTWKDSQIRSFLNGYSSSKNADWLGFTTNGFYTKAFSKEEKDAIATTNVNGCNDKVFLLSKNYFTNPSLGFKTGDGDRTFPSSVNYDISRVCHSTGYSLYKYPENHNNMYQWILDSKSSKVAFIDSYGRIENSPKTDELSLLMGVRPAIWLDLSKISFTPIEENLLAADTRSGARVNTRMTDALTSGYVRCPVDVIIRDANDNIVGKIIDNQPQGVADKDLILEVNGDEKHFVFPAEKEYKIELIGNDNGSMDYTLSRFDEYGSEIERLAYFDVEVHKDVSMNQEYIPETPIEEMTLCNENHEVVETSNVVTGADIGQLSVTVVPEGRGYASSMYSRTEGDLVELNAVPDDGNSFIGWYDEQGSLISENASYSFIIKNNMTITAQFTDEAINIEKLENYVDKVYIEINSLMGSNVHIYPENASEPFLSYKSSDENVAIIDDAGCILAVGPGETHIVAKTKDECIR